MYYVFAYHHNTNGKVLALNQKGQLIGSKNLDEAIKMLPEYNYYNKDDPKQRDQAPVWQFVFHTYIIKLDSLQVAFRSMKERKKDVHYGKKIYYAIIHPECLSIL